MIDVLEAYPDEHVVNYSPTVVGAGFVLIVCVCVLGVFVWAGRGERLVEGWEKLPEWERYRPDWLGKRVSVVEIAARYRTTWAAGAIWPSGDAPAAAGAGRDRRQLAVHADVGLSGVWLFMTASSMFAGAIEEIEVFREEQLLSGAVCAGLALVLCGFWIVIFRIPFFSRAEKREIEAELTRIRADMKAANDPRAVAPTAVMPDLERGKGAWTWVGFWMLVVAWVLATSAALTVRAWTLPSEQYGMLLFVAPGFGLLSGWLLYAASVNFGVAYQADSYPDGVRPVPTGGGTFAYRGSLWPVAVAAVAGLVALIGAEPAHPVPLVVALVFFAPRYWQNIAAIVLGLVGVLLGVVRVWAERS